MICSGSFVINPYECFRKTSRSVEHVKIIFRLKLQNLCFSSSFPGLFLSAQQATGLCMHNVLLYQKCAKCCAAVYLKRRAQEGHWHPNDFKGCYSFYCLLQTVKDAVRFFSSRKLAQKKKRNRDEFQSRSATLKMWDDI